MTTNEFITSTLTVIDSNWQLFTAAIPVAWAIRRIFAADVKAFLEAHNYVTREDITTEGYLRLIQTARGGTRLLIDSIGVLVSTWALRVAQIVTALGLIIQLVRYAASGNV